MAAEAYERKKLSYEDLAAETEQRGWLESVLESVEVVCRDAIAQ